VKRAINDNIKRLSSPSEDIAQIMYVLTDGQENFSSAYDDTYWTEVKALVESLNDDWTVIAMVPRKQQATFTKIGFAPGNILEWDTTNEGLDIGTQSVTRSSVQYTAQRSAGVKKSVNYFQADFKKITADNIAKEAKRLSKRDFYIAQNGEQVMEMRPMIEATGGEYVEGNHFYALIKNETVQPQKKLVVIDKSTGYAYGGDGIRKLLGLPNSPVMMTPAFSPAYDIFVQSSAPNRKIMPTQKVFCLKEKSK
jgi:hypothetical protein